MYISCASNTLTIPTLSLFSIYTQKHTTLDISQPPKETLQLLTQHHPTNQ